MAGEIETFYTVELDDLLYKSFQRFTSKDWDVSRMDQETSTRVARRYPGAKIEKGYGYNITYRTFAELEPDSNQLIRDAVTLAKRDGQSLETVLMVAEKAYHVAAKAA